MKTVLKYTLELKSGLQHIKGMPVEPVARIVHLAVQHDKPVMWAEVTDTPSVQDFATGRIFQVLATGEPLNRHDDYCRYVDTIHVSWTVWHVYEIFGVDAKDVDPWAL